MASNGEGSNSEDNEIGLENEHRIPTLRQIWIALKQLQQDMAQIKIQINEERALRDGLQQVLISHLEKVAESNILY